MARHNGSGGRNHTTKQKGRYRRGGVGTYSRLKKGRQAERYDRPAIVGGHAK